MLLSEIWAQQQKNSGISVFRWYFGISVIRRTRTQQNILSKPLAAFPRTLCLKNGLRWGRNESWCNDFHQSPKRILAEHKPATSCSQVLHATDRTMELSLSSIRSNAGINISKKTSRVYETLMHPQRPFFFFFVHKNCDLDIWPWLMTLSLVLKKGFYSKEYIHEIWKLYRLPFKSYSQC